VENVNNIVFKRELVDCGSRVTLLGGCVNWWFGGWTVLWVDFGFV
jgi:hypothetical protein